MFLHGLALAVIGFYENATVAHRRRGLGESIQLQGWVMFKNVAGGGVASGHKGRKRPCRNG